MKRIVLLSLMTFIAVCTQAQFYSSEAYIFLEAGKDPKKSLNSWKIILFKGKEAFNIDTSCKDFDYIKNCLKKNPNYFDNKDCGDFDNKDCGDYKKEPYTYSPTSSTNSEYVYKRYTPKHYVYVGYGAGYWIRESYEKIVLNKEESSLVYYSSRDNRKFDKTYYILIPKSEIIKLIAPGVNNSFME